jgi:sugar/nucleoside kinase (ribokinase family)
MWELEHTGEDALRRVKNVIGIADMWSLNLSEASMLFDIPREREEDMINLIMKMPVEMTLFRVGKRGAYCVTPTNAVFCPSIDIAESVDPTGCGNCSTGAAMYAHLEGYSPAEVVAIANISAGFNAAQFGPYPLFTEVDMSRAQALLKETIRNMTK